MFSLLYSWSNTKGFYRLAFYLKQYGKGLKLVCELVVHQRLFGIRCVFVSTIVCRDQVARFEAIVGALELLKWLVALGVVFFVGVGVDIDLNGIGE
jgi:hypothetical protein